MLSNAKDSDDSSVVGEGRRPPRGSEAAHFAFGLASFENAANGKQPPRYILIDFKSSEDCHLTH